MFIIKSMISIEDFSKVEMKAGKILSAEKIPDTDKLLKLQVDFGVKAPAAQAGASAVPGVSEGIIPASPIIAPAPERDIRQIISGISQWFPDPSVLAGRICMFVTNLEPRVIRGYESKGMILALSTPGGAFSLLEPNNKIPEGTKAR